MNTMMTLHRGRKIAAVRLCALLLVLAFARMAGAQTNTKTGTNAGIAITTGTNNTADGFSALQADTTGSRNVAIGSVTLKVNVAGADNTAVGHGALTANLASSNTALGSQALFGNTVERAMSRSDLRHSMPIPRVA